VHNYTSIINKVYLFLFSHTIIYNSMFSISGSETVDKNAILSRDESIQRQIAINLQRKFDPLSKAMFWDKQMELYPNLLQVSNEPFSEFDSKRKRYCS
jgi:hypothetical protein